MSAETKTKSAKTYVGEVASSKMDKTVVVIVQRKMKHPLYKKYINRRKKYYAHDEQNQCGVGDRVRIVETRPISKHKRWRVSEIVEKAK